MNKQQNTGRKTIALNKRARFEYFIEERFEAGIALEGWEVKALREARIQFADSYVLLKDGEAFLFGSQINPLPTVSTHIVPDPTRTRKLLLHSAEIIQRLLHDPDLQGEDLVAPPGERREEFVAMLEAPRGTLTHHYRVNERDQVTMANLIVSTTCNNEPMNRAVRRIADEHLSGRPVITEGLLNNIEVGIRAYDPCLSCATHALGQMPLEVTLLGPDEAVLDRRTREG